MRVFVGGLLVGAWLVTATVWAAPEPDKASPPAPTVRYRNDKLSVDARGADLAAVLKAIAHESGAELVGAPRAEQTITVAFDDVPLKEALERLVGAQNFTLKYDEGGKLKAIELRGGQEAAEKPKPADTGPTAAGNTTPPKWYAFYKAFDRPDTIPLPPDLRKAFGKDEVGYDYLGNAAIGHQDPRIRQEALHTLMKALDQDPEMKEAVLASLGAMTDEELAAFARQTAHYRAEDLVRNALRETSDRELRSRAREVLRELRKIPFKGPRAPMH
jgi:hypothetical protein